MAANRIIVKFAQNSPYQWVTNKYRPHSTRQRVSVDTTILILPVATAMLDAMPPIGLTDRSIMPMCRTTTGMLNAMLPVRAANGVSFRFLRGYNESG